MSTKSEQGARMEDWSVGKTFINDDRMNQAWLGKREIEKERKLPSACIA